MIRSWLKNEQGFDNVKIVSIPDIDNPPMWVSHAEKYHGKNGSFFSSDSFSAELYSKAGWNVVKFPLEKRDQDEGWRVRATALMLSTINDDEAIRTVLSLSLPESTIDYLIKIDGFRRLAFLVRRRACRLRKLLSPNNSICTPSQTSSKTYCNYQISLLYFSLFTDSAKAIGTLAAAVLPYLSKFVYTLSIDNPRLSIPALIIL